MRALALFALVPALIAGCAADEPRAPRIERASARAIANPIQLERPIDDDRIALRETATSLGAFPADMTGEAMASALLAEDGWPATTAKSVRVVEGGETRRGPATGTPLVIQVDPMSADDLAKMLRFVGEENPFFIERVVLSSARGAWHGTIIAAGLTYDPGARSFGANAQRRALLTYERVRSTARERVLDTIRMNPDADAIEVVWSAPAGGYLAGVERRPADASEAGAMIAGPAGDEALRRTIDRLARETGILAPQMSDTPGLGADEAAKGSFHLSFRGTGTSITRFIERLEAEPGISVTGLAARAAPTQQGQGGYIAEAVVARLPRGAREQSPRVAVAPPVTAAFSKLPSRSALVEVEVGQDGIELELAQDALDVAERYAGRLARDEAYAPFAAPEVGVGDPGRTEIIFRPGKASSPGSK